MTLYSWGKPAYFPRLPKPSRAFSSTSRARTRVVADCHWHSEPWNAPDADRAARLNGSSDAHYMRGLAAKAFARGLNVVRAEPAQLRRHRASLPRAVSTRASPPSGHTSSTS
jgi:hypothetical protein